MAGCADAIHCMNSKRTLGEWDLCLEINVHANLHPWMGGCWDCHGGDDWGTLTARNATFWPEDVLDFVGPNLATIWNSRAPRRPLGRGHDVPRPALVRRPVQEQRERDGGERRLQVRVQHHRRRDREHVARAGS